jgi:serine/threonine protein kinase
MPNTTPSLDTIFAEAIELPDPATRADYLARACGHDDALRRRVEALVAAHFRAGGTFLEQPVITRDATAAFAPASGDAAGPGVGTAIGPYTLREPLGEGGMGLVYVAEQTRPVRRKVALKVIKPGMDSRAVVARFEAERQALALMDHPHIATVLDAGTTESGRPYFVMELVKGEPVTDYCDRHRLDLRRRLELFLQVCGAVQHAHQKGVIHRDLKPSNVLVAVHDVAPVAKVIDFGIAKAVGPALTDKTVFTGFGAVVGTPLYMSPGAGRADQLDVDTRSDVYAWGCCCTSCSPGTTPSTRERVQRAGPCEVRRIVREEDTPRPVRPLGGADAREHRAVRGTSRELSRLCGGSWTGWR